MDENRIEKMWEDFANSYKAAIQKVEQQLLIFPDKINTYSVAENINGQLVLYEYKYHSLDPIGGGALLWIVIPVVAKNELLIYKPSFFRRILFREKIIIKSSGLFVIKQKIINSIINLFKDHPDLKIRLGASVMSYKSIAKDKTIILMIQTKHLPTSLKKLESLREVTLQLFSYLCEVKAIIG